MTMLIALIHWRIRPEAAFVDQFLTHWRTKNRIEDKTGLIGEFLSDPLDNVTAPYITWHLDGESLGDFRSFVTIGLWSDETQFEAQIARYFNDDKPLEAFEKYRRRRVVFNPRDWRIGGSDLPIGHSDGVI